MNTENFNPHAPMKTIGNWSARLLGIVEHKEFPLVVAVTNPFFDREEVYFYTLDGQSFTPREYADGTPDSVHTGHFALQNYGPWVDTAADTLERVNKPTDFVHPSVELRQSMDMSVSSNPFRYDHFSMGTSLVRDLVILHEGYDNKDRPLACTWFDVYNCRSGQVFRVHMTQHMSDKVKAKLARP